MLCPECGEVVAPSPMRAHEASDEAVACSGMTTSTGRADPGSYWRRRVTWFRSLLSPGLRADPSLLEEARDAFNDRHFPFSK